jgi:hypothetical protein
MLISLLLCPDRSRIDDTYSKNIIHTTLPRLRTGKGINIGDTPQQVRRKLGSQPATSQYNYKSKQRVLTWKAPIMINAEGRWQNWAYRGIYTFRNERLWAIKYVAVDETESAND